MTQGETPKTRGMFNLSRDYCDRTLPETSIYRLLYDIGDELFPSEFFADLYQKTGRNSVPPRLLATVMVLQRLGGLSDREAADRFMYDARWKYACGGLDADYDGFGSTVLVYMRARLRNSDSPTRIFDAVLSLAKDAGLVGVRRVLDSTPLYDAVATQDTVTLIRSAIRGVLKLCDKETKSAVYEVLERDDTYVSPGKPSCAWDDADARMALVDALARDGYAVLAYFDGESLVGTVSEKLRQALVLLATVLGQDLEFISTGSDADVDDADRDETNNAASGGKRQRSSQRRPKKARRRGRPRKRRKSGKETERGQDTLDVDADVNTDVDVKVVPDADAQADTADLNEGTFRIADKVAKDRVISTVDPETRHGHKTSARHFDGYKGHVAIDPDSEIITATAVTAGNAADGEPVADLISDLIAAIDAPPDVSSAPEVSSGVEQACASLDSDQALPPQSQPQSAGIDHHSDYTEPALGWIRRFFVATIGLLAAVVDSAVSAVAGATTIYADSTAPESLPSVVQATPADTTMPAFGCNATPVLYGDCAYGTASILSMLDGFGIQAMTRVQLPVSRGGRFSQANFQIDLAAATATCPADHTVNLRPQKDGTHAAGFGVRCRNCPMREQCTSSKTGRTITVHAQHDVLEAHRDEQRDADWQLDYKSTRPKVERKIGHMMRRKHGGRRARVRGRLRIELDFSLLAAATNLARLSRLGLNLDSGTWVVAAQ
jgi:transposase